MIKTIKIDFPVSGTEITLPFKAICSVTDKEFSGTLSIEYQPNELTLEYVDAERFVNEVCKKDIRAEDLVNETFNAVEKAISPPKLKVLADVTASKAHQPVRVWREKGF